MPKIVTGNGYDNTLVGTAFNDEIYGFGGNDDLSGGGGHDILDGGTGEDTMRGGSGDDVYIVDNESDQVLEYGGEGHDTIKSSVSINGLDDYVEDLFLTGSDNLFGRGNWLDNHIYGNAGDNKLYGGEGNDELHGGYGSDTLDGGLGNDTMFGGNGADTMKGGKDNDTYYVNQGGDVVTESWDEGIDLVRSTTHYTLTANVENLTLEGTANIDGAGNTLDNIIYGNTGNNMLFGYDGEDVLIGNGGSDSMWGGAGDDMYTVDDDDKVFEAANRGTDSVYYHGTSTYTLTANVENLSLYGAGGNGTGNGLHNTIHGNMYQNVIDGGAGQDHMIGYGGDDTYIVDNEMDVVEEAATGGVDTVYATANHTLASNVEILSLASGNAISGTGNGQSNTIYGNAGNNVLNGAGGADNLSGIGGNDTFVFHAGEAYGDSIFEFAGNGAAAGDVLEFHGYGTAAQGATLTFLFGDSWQITSADGSLQETIHLIGSPSIDASDYVFV